MPTSAEAAPRPGLEERLSRMIRIPTAFAELAARGSDPFEESPR